MIGRKDTGALSTNHMRACIPSLSKAETGFKLSLTGGQGSVATLSLSLSLSLKLIRGTRLASRPWAAVMHRSSLVSAPPPPTVGPCQFTPVLKVVPWSQALSARKLKYDKLVLSVAFN